MPTASELDDGFDEFFMKMDIEDLTTTRSTIGPPGKQRVVKNSPLQRLRPRYFYVSDFVTQSWCGQKAILNIEHPDYEADMQEALSKVDVTVQPVIKLGSAIHEKRELQVHTKKPVQVITAEDRFAIKLLNIHTLLTSLLKGKPLEREIPVFGMPLDLGVVIFGIIDEIRINHSGWTLTLSETKTRRSERLPQPTQEIGHRLQIMLYMRLFEDLIQRKTPWVLIMKILRMDDEKLLSESIFKELRRSKLEGSNLRGLWEEVMEAIAPLPKEIVLSVEYVSQKTEKTFLVREILYDDVLLRIQMKDFLDGWTGKVAMRGAPEHEAWKCHTCYFAEMCEWRLGKISTALKEKQPS